MGFSGARRAEYPVVSSDGIVVGFEAYLKETRKFPIDMAGFAVNVKYFMLEENPVLFTVNAPRTRGETMFLEATGEDISILEPMANMCTEVNVWHVKTTATVADEHLGSAPHIAEV